MISAHLIHGVGQAPSPGLMEQAGCNPPGTNELSEMMYGLMPEDEEMVAA